MSDHPYCFGFCIPTYIYRFGSQFLDLFTTKSNVLLTDAPIKRQKSQKVVVINSTDCLDSSTDRPMHGTGNCFES